MADAYPDRHVLGLGFGGPRPGIKPMAAMNEYLDELDALDGIEPGRSAMPYWRALGDALLSQGVSA